MASMDDFHCESFQMRIQADPLELRVDELLSALREQGIDDDLEPDEDGDVIAFGEFTGNGGYYAHLAVSLVKDRSGTIDLTYFSGSDDEPKGVVRVDDCASWLGTFFNKNVQIHRHINYSFPRPFSPVVNLPFPLVSSEKELAGAVVAGLALVLPSGTTAILHHDPEEPETYLFLRDTVERDLKQFNLFSELGLLTTTVNKLVKANE